MSDLDNIDEKEGVYRVAGMMPNKKEEYIKKAIQRIA
jgi:hypothetical protein